MHTRQSVAVPARVQDSVRKYPREVALDGTLMHSRFCQRTETRLDWTRCEKCVEMRSGLQLVPAAPQAQLELVSEDDLMYPLEVNLDGTTRHSEQCTGGFGRTDVRCHRCQELQHGRVRRGTGHRKSRSKRLAQMVGWLPIGG